MGRASEVVSYTLKTAKFVIFLASFEYSPILQNHLELNKLAMEVFSGSKKKSILGIPFIFSRDFFFINSTHLYQPVITILIAEISIKQDPSQKL